MHVFVIQRRAAQIRPTTLPQEMKKQKLREIDFLKNLKLETEELHAKEECKNIELSCFTFYTKQYILCLLLNAKRATGLVQCEDLIAS